MRENQNLIYGHSFDYFFLHFVVLYRICRFDIVDEVFHSRHWTRSNFHFMLFIRFNMIFESNLIIRLYSGICIYIFLFRQKTRVSCERMRLWMLDLNCMKLSSSFFDTQQRLYLYRMKNNFIYSTEFFHSVVRIFGFIGVRRNVNIFVDVLNI